MTNRTEAARNSRHPRTPLDGYLRIPLTHLPVFPGTLVDHALPFGVAVPEPAILRFLPAYFDGLDYQRLQDILASYDSELEAESLWMVTVALGADLYWKGRSFFVEDPVIALLHRTVELPSPSRLSPLLYAICKRRSASVT